MKGKKRPGTERVRESVPRKVMMPDDEARDGNGPVTRGSSRNRHARWRLKVYFEPRSDTSHPSSERSE